MVMKTHYDTNIMVEFQGGMKAWMDATCQGTVIGGLQTPDIIDADPRLLINYSFEIESDATLFALRWGEYIV